MRLLHFCLLPKGGVSSPSIAPASLMNSHPQLPFPFASCAHTHFSSSFVVLVKRNSATFLQQIASHSLRAPTLPLVNCQHLGATMSHEEDEMAEKRASLVKANVDRDPARTRSVSDTSVAIAKFMIPGRPGLSAAKRRAEKLGLKVDLQAAKRLHWKSIQIRPPAVLTAGPSSPLRTPRRPALEYPSAERLYLINAQNAKSKEEAHRWLLCAEREHRLSKWEAVEREPPKFKISTPQICVRGTGKWRSLPHKEAENTVGDIPLLLDSPKSKLKLEDDEMGLPVNMTLDDMVQDGQYCFSNMQYIQTFKEARSDFRINQSYKTSSIENVAPKESSRNI